MPRNKKDSGKKFPAIAGSMAKPDCGNACLSGGIQVRQVEFIDWPIARDCSPVYVVAGDVTSKRVAKTRKDAYRYTARLQANGPNATVQARAIFGPARKPVINQAALQAAIVAMQDQAKREATAQKLLQHSTVARK